MYDTSPSNKEVLALIAVFGAVCALIGAALLAMALWIASVVDIDINLENSAHALVCDGPCLDKPANGFIARWAGSTAVCVGPRTLISARHTGGQVGLSAVIDGEYYKSVAIDYGPQTQDIQVITVDRDLPGWHRIAPEINSGDEVVLGGNGWGPPEDGALPQRWRKQDGGTRVERWGTNTVGSASLHGISIDMSKDITDHEAVFVLNDSGAGLFIENDQGELFLAGIAVSASAYKWGTAQHGDRSGLVNLVGTSYDGLTYATQQDFEGPQMPFYPPEMARTADTNSDGRVNGADFSLIVANMGKDTTKGDLNNDGVVDHGDFDVIVIFLGEEVVHDN